MREPLPTSLQIARVLLGARVVLLLPLVALGTLFLPLSEPRPSEPGLGLGGWWDLWFVVAPVAAIALDVVNIVLLSRGSRRALWWIRVGSFVQLAALCYLGVGVFLLAVVSAVVVLPAESSSASEWCARVARRAERTRE
ncbi:hypothetical protein DFP74_1767 [Nocardiopsis sp. Huas11]|uniref:hypothetical protein n=1 Tax=Nocardiopsis sp. Huas11 TaxID=2183912 RepID=UPI000EB55B24|nr:hypothetical protein [Nocardiopsis sp. Huas11]RKS06143.1 hypothetical protein DFP74_1767 [Nocardiopsis sp. Huas11]